MLVIRSIGHSTRVWAMGIRRVTAIVLNQTNFIIGSSKRISQRIRPREFSAAYSSVWLGEMWRVSPLCSRYSKNPPNFLRTGLPHPVSENRKRSVKMRTNGRQMQGLRCQPRFRDSDGAPLGHESDSCSNPRSEHRIRAINKKRQAIREMVFGVSLIPQEFVQIILRTGFGPVPEIQR